jgi:hypothetical protein
MFQFCMFGMTAFMDYLKGVALLPETTRARQVLALSAREAGGVMEVSGVMG